ncbi:dihydrolipoamide acetyltransferase family protein [Roseomonas haemaphysalidis]|uniref:Dihydrolipoamide acetyltransferase component of pyruvate dehydrogenase complex n=1 Tax=Roseomonas haemaphysalidis TaxID=2768162 RepID=A0ABS3KP78_9PROT|nr:2-oxo acid dehydrogenase subunit E2 [Roseomonas haemaphysalidis]MBO1079227.1 2-oxo acid dehydrogenase subunit E2 [Roseomonas haemaphysalidis]
MMTEVLSPLSQEGTTAAIRTWFKAVGDRVAEGEPLLELETDKVAMEVAAPASGVLAAILVAAGDVQPGALLGHITPGEAATPPRPAVVPPPAAALADPEHRLSPAVRKLVSESGIDPAGLPGTGKDGRLTRDDVVRALQARATPAMPPQPSAGSTSIPHSPMRRRIAEHMAHSVATAPHVTALFEADFSAIIAHRAANKAGFAAQGVNLTFTAYFIAASVAAMQAAPTVNSRWHDDRLEVFSAVNIGIGTALGDQGLVVPVIHAAQSLSLLGIAQTLQAVTQRARTGTLAPEDVRGGTFTISNHGTSGSLLAAPVIINQPQSAILGIGKVEKRVVVREVAGGDAMLIRPMSFVSLTIDHRVIDGAQTNAWLTRFVDTLENWPA